MPSSKRVRRQSMWIVRQLAGESGVTEAQAKAALLELIARGHLKIIKGAGPDGSDLFEPIIKEARR